MLRSFRFNIAYRVILVAALSVAFAYVTINTNWFFTPTIIAVVWLAVVISLVAYIEKTNKDLTSFLLNIRQGNYTSLITSAKRGKSFSKLSNAFNDVITELEKLDFERETHYQYLQTLTENIGIGIISYDAEGKIQLLNPEAKRLLQISRMSSISFLNQIHPKLHQAVTELHSGERQLVQLPIGRDSLSLSIHSKELKLNEVPYKVVLLQDLKSELEDKEVEAWQKLIRVLTHEIMNSVTPIVTLSEALNRIVKKEDNSYRNASELEEEALTDIYESLATIESRSKGLLKFVNAYKNFSKTQDAKMSRSRLSDILNNVITLMKPEFESKHIQVEVEKSDALAMADKDLTEQVIINMLRNAIDALTGDKEAKILLEVVSAGSKVILRITDNGPGVEKELMDKIFVPFFTTKKMGTGIGLSWSRQIMRLQNGNLILRSEPGKGTCVELEFMSG
jgi:nitrogen fixation/metabolism regulation signal transduction histidine kinase